MTQDPHEPAVSLRSRRWKAIARIVAATLAVTFLATGAYRQFFRQKSDDPVLHTPSPTEAGLPPDPRLAYKGPFRNVHPDIGYAGDAKCAECHADIADTYS